MKQNADWMLNTIDQVSVRGAIFTILVNVLLMRAQFFGLHEFQSEIILFSLLFAVLVGVNMIIFILRKIWEAKHGD